MDQVGQFFKMSEESFDDQRREKVGATRGCNGVEVELELGGGSLATRRIDDADKCEKSSCSIRESLLTTLVIQQYQCVYTGFLRLRIRDRIVTETLKDVIHQSEERVRSWMLLVFRQRFKPYITSHATDSTESDKLFLKPTVGACTILNKTKFTSLVRETKNQVDQIKLYFNLKMM